MENQRLLTPQPSAEKESSSGEECTPEESSGSFDFDSDSSEAEWEPYIDDDTGELFYVECHPFVTQNANKEKKEPSESFARNQRRRSTRGKFLRLIRRRESKRRSKKAAKSQEAQETNTAKVKFQDFQEGEEKEVMLEIDKDNRHNLSSDVSMAESLLGLNVSTLSDGYRVMIAGFSIDSKAKHERNIKIGDWLKSINNIDVNYQNLDDILQKFMNRDEVLLKLQRVAGIEVTKDPPINELNNESDFVRELKNRTEINPVLHQIFLQHPIGLIYIDTNNLSENNAEFDDVIYCFPRPLQKNILCISRGMYITLNQLIDDITNSKPRCSTVYIKKRRCNVIYNYFDKKLMLLLLPANRSELKESLFVTEDLIRMLKFTYETLDKCFNSPTIDHFVAHFFMRILNGGYWLTTQEFLEMQLSEEPSSFQFEDILSAAVTLALPDEAQSQIMSALNELAACDYRDSNEVALDCQRLFTIVSCALYHDGYLLANHCLGDDLKDIHSFLKQQGIIHLSRTEPIKSLVFWKEIFPNNRLQTIKELAANKSKEENEKKNMLFEEKKNYLLICGSGKDILAVIMEAGGCTEPAYDNMGPDPFYVEEVQATLAHLQELGLPQLADGWLQTNPGPQVTLPRPSTYNKKKNEFNIKNTPLESSKKNEVTSILKRRSSDQNFVMHYSSTSSLQDDYYDAQSEGSGSQEACSERSEISDESGNRKYRLKNKYDSDEDSNNDDFMSGSQISGSSFDVSELRQTLLTDLEDFQPSQLTAGAQNVLFHFVQIDTTEGVIIAPPECRLWSPTLKKILNNFRNICHHIHTIFENTLRFKKMNPQEMATSVMNKSLIAIKEHGVGFESPYLDEKDSNKRSKITYYVVGRLFFIPHPKELYVCFKDDIPQNLIELGFKLNQSTIS